MKKPRKRSKMTASETRDRIDATTYRLLLACREWIREDDASRSVESKRQDAR